MSERIEGACHCRAVRISVPANAFGVVKNVLGESKPGWYELPAETKP